MNYLNIEKCKKDKEEYDKKIRSLDYKIVETSVKMYNSKSYKNEIEQEKDENNEVNQLKNVIIQFELEKQNLTKDFFNKVINIRNDIKNYIDIKMKENPNEKGTYITTKLALNKINDVYFEPNELVEILKRIHFAVEDDNNTEDAKEKTETQSVQIQDEQETNNADEIISTIFKAEKQDCLNRTVTQPVQSFNIKEQRIIDFENLLNCIENISKYYRTEIEKILSKFIINYQVVKNTQYLQNDFDNVTNNYLKKLETTINKFQKDENIDFLQNRIKDRENVTKDLESKILINDGETKKIENQMQELSNICFVGGYVRKILNQLEQRKNSKENNAVNNNVTDSELISDDVFQKIKKLAYDKRMGHIIEISKWTKNIEEKLRFFHLEETDFQFAIYMIRQTESRCNANFESVASIIIRLCDANLHLEQIEENEKSKNEELQEKIKVLQILQNGIENIKKKYSKIPFIGRKVTAILSAKMLNN